MGAAAGGWELTAPAGPRGQSMGEDPGNTPNPSGQSGPPTVFASTGVQATSTGNWGLCPVFVASARRGQDTSAGTRDGAWLPFYFSGCLFVLLFCSKMPHVAASALDPGSVPHPQLLGQG